MKKTKKLFVVILFFILLILANNIVNASSSELYLQNLNFDVKLNSDGSMDVTETWDIDIEDTNTLYKTFELDNTRFSDITNVEVKEITNGLNKDFSKIYNEMYHVTKGCYYGLINSKGDFEIAWGIGMDHDDGRRQYQISYTVEDAIAKYDDCTELYWQFVGKDFEVDAKKITGTITLPQKAEHKSDIRVWGHTEDLNGEIYVTSKDTVKFTIDKFNSGRFVEVRIAMPEDMIIYTGRTNYYKSLQDIIDEEIVWANEANARRERRELIQNIIFILFYVVTAVIAFFMIKRIAKNKQKLKEMKKFVPNENFEYYRDIPNDNTSPGEALYLEKQVFSNLSSTEIGQVFTATLLDLSLKKYIKFQVEKEEKKKEKIIINILNTQNTQSLPEDEKTIFEFLLKACKGQDSITSKELEQYIKSNSSEVVSLKSKIENSIVKTLVAKGFYDVKEKEKCQKYEVGIVGYAIFLYIQIFITIFAALILTPFTLIGSAFLAVTTIVGIVINIKMKKHINVYTQEGVNEMAKWKGLNKFMEDFSMLDKREIPEIAIWEKYLVYATAFGIADKVLKQLKVVYPDIENINGFDTGIYFGLMVNTNFSSSFSHSISSAMSSSYSSGSGGGGGFSGGGGRWRRPVAGGGGR